MKKGIIALAVAASISSSLIPGALAVDNLPSFTIRRDGGYSVKPGQDITYTVRLSNAEGIEQIGSIIEYDKSVLDYVDGSASMDFSYSVAPRIEQVGNTVQAGITFSGKYNVSDSDVYTVKFRVKDDADGLYYMPVRLVEGKSRVTYYGNSLPSLCNVNNTDYYIWNLYVGDAADVLITADKEELKCGEEITYTVNFPEEFKADSFGINIKYSDNLEYIGSEGLLTGETVDKDLSEERQIKIYWYSSTGDQTLNGDVAKLRFRANLRGYSDVYTTDSSAYTVDSKDYEISFNGDWIETPIFGSMDVNIVPDKTAVISGDKVHVSVTTSNAADLEGVGFTLRYENTMFKLADAPENNLIPGVMSGATAVCDEEGEIVFKWLATSSAGYLNGDVELMSFDLIATGSNDGSYMWFEDIDTSLGDVVEYNDSSEVYIYPKNDDEVIDVQTLIDAIPEINSENYNSDEISNAIYAAEAKYNLLPEVKQQKVDRTKLDNAKTMIADYTAAADKAAADAVNELLNALTVTEENWQDAPEAIAAVQTAYNALSNAGKTLVDGYDEKITAAQMKYSDFAQAAADKAAADKAAATVATNYIDAIGEVTENSGNAIALAENMYNNLTDDQKALVPDESKAALTAAREAYDAILAQKADEEAEKEKAEADKAAADNVVALINALDAKAPTFTDDAKAAQEAYDALTDDQKALVENYGKIAEKTAEYDAIKDILVTIEQIGGSYIVASTERKPLEAHQTVIAVSYNKDLTVASVKFISSDNGKAVVSGDSAKAFVWNSANGMIPYASVEKVEK